MRGVTLEMTKEVADRLMGGIPTNFRPRALSRETETTVYCSGREIEISQFCDLVAKAKRQVAAVSDIATPAQRAYLAALIDSDFGAATTIGARITPELTKAAASRFIDMLKAGV